MDPIPDPIEKVSIENLTTHLFALSADPLPCRQLNYTLPGHEKCTLHEADDFIVRILSEWGYNVEKEAGGVCGTHGYSGYIKVNLKLLRCC